MKFINVSGYIYDILKVNGLSASLLSGDFTSSSSKVSDEEFGCFGNQQQCILRYKFILII